MEAANDERQTIMGNHSTLEVLDMAYGDNTSSSWVVAALANLNRFAGSKNMDDEQTEQLSKIIAHEYKHMKISVMQLFFYRFKCGHFGKFYGKVDPMVITCALKDFSEECEKKRQEYLNEEFEERRAEKDAIRRKMLARWYTCHEELCETSSDREARRAFQSIWFVSFDDASNTLLLKVSRETYDQIEGPFFGVFGSVIRRHYPAVRVRYSFLPQSVPFLREKQEPLDLRTKERMSREICQGIESARAVVNNTLNLGKEGLANLRRAFKLRYKQEPEYYLKSHQSRGKSRKD